MRAAHEAGVVADRLLRADPAVAPEHRDMHEAYTTLGFLAAHGPGWESTGEAPGDRRRPSVRGNRR